MPKSKRYGRAGGLPATIRRSSPDVQGAFTKAHQEAVQVHGEGDQADRAAFEVLKQGFEKRGDHWIAKRDPVGRSANPVPTARRDLDPAASSRRHGNRSADV